MRRDLAEDAQHRAGRRCGVTQRPVVMPIDTGDVQALLRHQIDVRIVLHQRHVGRLRERHHVAFAGLQLGVADRGVGGQLADRGILLSPGDIPAGGTGRREKFTDASLRKAF